MALPSNKCGNVNDQYGPGIIHGKLYSLSLILLGGHGLKCLIHSCGDAFIIDDEGSGVQHHRSLQSGC